MLHFNSEKLREKASVDYIAKMVNSTTTGWKIQEMSRNLFIVVFEFREPEFIFPCLIRETRRDLCEKISKDITDVRNVNKIQFPLRNATKSWVYLHPSTNFLSLMITDVNAQEAVLQFTILTVFIPGC